MANLGKRILKRVRMTATSFRSDLHFSFGYACLRIGDELGGRIGLRRLSRYCMEKRKQWIMDHLRKRLQPVFQKYSSCEDTGQFQENAPIWVCWWTGEETAPALVKKCLESIRKSAGAHPVYLITQDNVHQYLEIPACLLEKHRGKTMGAAHLSDYIRFSLLEKYGGLWLDATIYCPGPIQETVFHSPLFTCKSAHRNKAYVSEYQWTTFCFGGYKNSVVFSYIRAALEAYWIACDYAIDYLFLDYVIKLGEQGIPTMGTLLDRVPVNNPHRDDLAAAMWAGESWLQFKKHIHPDTCFYKLSWREHYEMRTPDGENTVYGYFLEQ